MPAAIEIVEKMRHMDVMAGGSDKHLIRQDRLKG